MAAAVWGRPTRQEAPGGDCFGGLSAQTTIKLQDLRGAMRGMKIAFPLHSLVFVCLLVRPTCLFFDKNFDYKFVMLYQCRHHNSNEFFILSKFQIFYKNIVSNPSDPFLELPRDIYIWTLNIKLRNILRKKSHKTSVYTSTQSTKSIKHVNRACI